MHITRLPKLLTQAKGAKKPRDGRSMSSASTLGSDVPKGHLAVYVGDVCNTSRFVIPVAYLNHPLFKGLLRKAEEEFGFEHPMGGLTLPCSEEDFLNLISQLSGF